MANDELFVLVWTPQNAKDRHAFKGCDVINTAFLDVLNVKMIMQGKLRGWEGIPEVRTKVPVAVLALKMMLLIIFLKLNDFSIVLPTLDLLCELRRPICVPCSLYLLPQKFTFLIINQHCFLPKTQPTPQILASCSVNVTKGVVYHVQYH